MCTSKKPGRENPDLDDGLAAVADAVADGALNLPDLLGMLGSLEKKKQIKP